jgi:Tfp pilus assembly protein PilF
VSGSASGPGRTGAGKGAQDPRAAIAALERAVAADPTDPDRLNRLGGAYLASGDAAAAVERFRRVTALVPESPDAHFNLAVALHAKGDLAAAEHRYRATLAIDDRIPDAHNNLGLVRFALGHADDAIASYERALALRPDFPEAHHNLGVAHQQAGDLEAAVACFDRALGLRPAFPDAHNHRGNALVDLGRVDDGRRAYLAALQARPDYADALWNLSGTAETVAQARALLERCLACDPGHERARLMLAGLAALDGDRAALDALEGTAQGEHPFVRSFRWVLSLPERPRHFFDRWSLFDAVLAECDRERPFYEFGVWRGASFRYLIRTLGSGFGFDTFEGLPEDWHDTRRGSYSSGGRVPRIDGGEFVVGRFEDTLPGFFAQPRPQAALVHLDADLYSATRCALAHAKAVIDERTVLVFDELLMNDDWEQDEFRALHEFCAEQGLRFRVLAVSFFTKQAAVRLTQ